MRHRSILEYAHFRWLKVALMLSLLAAVAYLWDDPGVKPHGGTPLGYTLGIRLTERARVRTRISGGAVLIWWPPRTTTR